MSKLVTSVLGCLSTQTALKTRCSPPRYPFTMKHRARIGSSFRLFLTFTDCSPDPSQRLAGASKSQGFAPSTPCHLLYHRTFRPFQIAQTPRRHSALLPCQPLSIPLASSSLSIRVALLIDHRQAICRLQRCEVFLDTASRSHSCYVNRLHIMNSN